jgi:ERCC4-type nuclease
MRQLKMIVDNRERNFEILEGLEEQGVEMTFAQLPVGDYIISDRICVERKTVSDFEGSIINSRLFDQVKRLHESFAKPILLIEGSRDEARLSSNVMLGTIMKLYVDYNTQVVISSDEQETAYILSRFAEHEQNEEKREPRLVGLKKAYTDDQWQIFILSSIPGIGVKLAKKLISHFKTVRGVASASVDDLVEVEKIGKKKAERIYSILNAEFDGG